MAANNNHDNHDQAFPELTIDVGRLAGRSGTVSASPLGQTVENALREVLAWRPKTSDPKGFLAALNQSFTVQDVEGHTEWSWTPRSYSVQADMGAVTGAQASIYARARAALDQSVPLLEGLYPLRADADTQDVEAIRAVVQAEMTELINELGAVGGPRLHRVDGLFDSLLGDDPIENDPEKVAGLLGALRKQFGLTRERVNTIDEEQNLTNNLIVVEHVISLRQSWQTQRHFFNRKGSDVFLGTQLVLLSRALGVVAESVQETYLLMDSVWLSAAERQVVQLDSGLTIAELLDWVERFASEEALQIIREAGKDGVIAFRPTVKRLVDLVEQAWRQSKNQENNSQAGFHHVRVRTALEELTLHLREAFKLTNQIKRLPPPKVFMFEPEQSLRGEMVRLVVDGENFQPGASLYLTEWGEGKGKIQAKRINIVGPTEIKAHFDLNNVMSNKWAVVVKNPDGESASAAEPFWIIDDEALDGDLFINRVSPPSAPNTGSTTLTIRGGGFQAGAEVKLTKEGTSPIKGTNEEFTENGETITATFNLRNKKVGLWDVEVKNQDDDNPIQSQEIFTISLPPKINSVESFPLEDPGNKIGLKIFGENFQIDADVELIEKELGESIEPVSVKLIQGQKTIQTENIGEPNENEIIATFTLPNDATGQWDVVVTNWDGGEDRKKAAFKVN